MTDSTTRLTKQPFIIGKSRARPSLAALPDFGYRTSKSHQNLKSSPSRYTLSDGTEFGITTTIFGGRDVILGGGGGGSGEGGGGGDGGGRETRYFMDGPPDDSDQYRQSRKLTRAESSNRLRKKSANRKKVSIPGLNEEFIAMSMRQKEKRNSAGSNSSSDQSYDPSQPEELSVISRSTLTGTNSQASSRDYNRSSSRLTLNFESKTETSSEFTTGELNNILFPEPPKQSLTKTNHPVTNFVLEFNILAKKHGLQPLPNTFQAEPYQQSVSSAPSTEPSLTNLLPYESRPRKFLNKLLKRSNSTRAKGSPKVVEFKNRRVSMGDISAIGKGKKDTLKGMHLEDIIRLGGVCEFMLPKKYTPGRLFVPTCFHAAATFIFNNGMQAPGLFRTTGNPVATWSLYDYYQRQLVDTKGVFEQGVTLAALPTNLQYSVNDVATLLKKLISGIPGGLLGSTAVFHALYNVQTFLFTPDLTPEDLSRLKARMIALALSSLNLHFRISLICQIFGLLKAITDATEPQKRKNQILNQAETFTLLKDDSFAVAFAPLLLGDKFNSVIIKEASEDRGGLQVLPSVTPTAAHKGGNSSRRNGLFKRNTAVEDAAKLEEEKLRRCALVVNMMLEEWESIVKELRRMETLKVTAKEYIVPGFEAIEREQETPEPVDHDATIRANRSRAYSDARDRDRDRDTTVRETRSRAYSDARDARKSMERSGGRARAKSTNQLLATEEEVRRVDDLRRSTRERERERERELEQRDRERQRKQEEQLLIVIEDRKPGSNERLKRKKSSPSPNYVVFEDEVSSDDEPILRTPPSRKDETVTIRPIYSPNYQLLEDDLLLGEPIVFREAERIIFEKARTPQTKVVHIQPGQITPPGAKSLFEIHQDAPEGVPELDHYEEPSRKSASSKKSSSHLSSKSRTSLKSKTSQLSINTASTALKRATARPLPTPPIRAPEKKPSSRTLQPVPGTRLNRTPSRLESFLADTNPSALANPKPTPTPNSKSSTPIPEPPTSPTALYAEVLRLQSLVDAKTREAEHARSELQIARNLAKAGALSHLVKEEKEETRVWRNRAGWAEGVIRGGAFTVPDLTQSDFGRGGPGAAGAGRGRGLMPPPAAVYGQGQATMGRGRGRVGFV